MKYENRTEVNNRFIFAKCERFEDYWNNKNNTNP